MCAAIFAVGSEDLPARVFLTYFTRKSAFKRFGFHPEGTIGLWRALAGAIESHGGQVWLSTPVVKIVSDGTKVTGVQAIRDSEAVTVSAPVVVSDVGPAATVKLLGEENVPADYQDVVKKGDRPTAMISVNFASQERLVDVPGMLSFAKSRRLAYIANFTDMCPEMAPPGWNLYVGTAVPKPSLGDFDEAAETELLMQDLRDTIDRFDERARILNIAVTRDDWPPQRAVAGFDLPQETPFEGLWNVGDAVKEYANGGTTACAETAKLVVDKITAAHHDTSASL
jgi:phytoene dehydrogenase-like protein